MKYKSIISGDEEHSYRPSSPGYYDKSHKKITARPSLCSAKTPPWTRTRKKPERRSGEQKLKTRSTKCLKVETVLRKSDCCSDGKVLSGDSWGCCAQATALLPLTRGVIIHEILLVTLFLEVVHSRVVHPPGVRNKTVHFAPPPNRQILCSQICSRDESLCVLANAHDPTETQSKFRRN